VTERCEAAGSRLIDSDRDLEPGRERHRRERRGHGGHDGRAERDADLPAHRDQPGHHDGDEVGDPADEGRHQQRDEPCAVVGDERRRQCCGR
jgi:hypothetical protein